MPRPITVTDVSEATKVVVKTKKWNVDGVDEATKNIVRRFAISRNIRLAEALAILVRRGAGDEFDD